MVHKYALSIKVYIHHNIYTLIHHQGEHTQCIEQVHVSGRIRAIKSCCDPPLFFFLYVFLFLFFLYSISVSLSSVSHCALPLVVFSIYLPLHHYHHHYYLYLFFSLEFFRTFSLVLSSGKREAKEKHNTMTSLHSFSCLAGRKPPFLLYTHNTTRCTHTHSSSTWHYCGQHSTTIYPSVPTTTI